MEENIMSKKISDQLFVGMPISKIIELLGEPGAKSSGGELLGAFRQVSGSSSALSNLARKEYWMWKRPEGEYQLIIEDGKLSQIHSTP
jgi:hypothetical protein